MGSYFDLETYQLAFHLATKEHKHSNTLPKIEQYELGSQVRKSDELFEDYQKRGKKIKFSYRVCRKIMEHRTDNR
jgi:hypothetical protein